MQMLDLSKLEAGVRDLLVLTRLGCDGGLY